MDDIIIVGGGIGGLTLALCLHELSIPCRVFEAAPTFKSLGVGINILPHAMRELGRLGLEDGLVRAGVVTREMCYYNRFGQFIHSDLRGRFAGYEWPQISIHRAALHDILLNAVRERLGADAIVLDHKFTHASQFADGVLASFATGADSSRQPLYRGRAVIGCDGVHSAVRTQLFPDKGALAFEGINMWRGVTRWPPFLTGASMALIGWLEVGKMVIYPIENTTDEQGRQLMNWTAEIQSPHRPMLDWNLGGKLEDVLPIFEDWSFPWLDVAGLVRNAEIILEYPMVDRDPLPRWTEGRMTLLGDAAHAMYPRGANGAAQAILDARVLAQMLARESDVLVALKTYENVRLEAANKVVLINRTQPSDYLLKVVHERSGDKPFEYVENLIKHEEIIAITEKYKRAAGFDRSALAT